jgi:hypothetical protein
MHGIHRWSLTMRRNLRTGKRMNPLVKKTDFGVEK